MTNIELYNTIEEAQRTLVENWEDQGKEVIALAFKARKFDGDMKTWLSFCTTCGGNWGGMLLSGVRNLYPEVWEAIPEDMGVFAWNCICNLLILLGVRTWE